MIELTSAEKALLDLLAYLNLRYGSATKAKAYLRMIISHDPDSSRLWRALALSELKSGHSEAAAEAAIRAQELSLDPNETSLALLLRAEIAHAAGAERDVSAIVDQFLLQKGAPPA